MASTVWYWNMRSGSRAPYANRIRKMVKASGFAGRLSPGDMVALKIHFGEAGGTGHIQPIRVKPVADFMKKAGARPFYTDTCTLYVGERGEAVSHHLCAAAHGYTPEIAGAPVIMADGLRGGYEVEVPFQGRHISSAWLGGGIVEADAVVTLNHFKGHSLAGFGGALKNLGMGCASKRGKMVQHLSTGPKAHIENCTGCGACVKRCAAGALSIGPDDTIVIDHELCAGCGACFMACRNNCLYIDWSTDVAAFRERLMEYAAAVVLPRGIPHLHINFLYDITPECDCVGFSDAPLCPDLGILASLDPVAVDQASLDLVAQAAPLYPSKLPKGIEPGQDKFHALHPEMPAEYGPAHAEQLGLGTREYKLVMI